MEILCIGTYWGWFSNMVIWDLWSISDHPVKVLSMVFEVLFILLSRHCVLRNIIKWSWCRSKNAKVLKKKHLSLTYFRESFGTTFLENIGCCWQVHLNLTHHKNKFLNKCFKSYGSMMSYHPGAPQMIETFNLNLYDIY